MSAFATTDIVIVGGGLAGLFCALKLAPRPVTVVTAAPIGEGASTAWAQGGIAAAVAEGDTPEAHARDTIAAGAGLVDEAVALAMAREAPERIRDLLALRRAVRQGSRRPPDRRPRGRAFGAPHRARARRPGRARHHGGARRGGARRRRAFACSKATSPRISSPEAGARHRRRGARPRGGRLAHIPARAVVLALGRRRPPLRRDHQSARGARPGPRDRGARRRGASPIRSSSSSIRPRSTSAAIRRRSRPKRCAAKARRWSTARASASCCKIHRRGASLRRATSWRAACSPSCRPGAARSSTPARRSAHRSRERFPAVARILAAAPASIRRAT